MTGKDPKLLFTNDVIILLLSYGAVLKSGLGSCGMLFRSTWTSLEDVATNIEHWLEGTDRPRYIIFLYL